MSGESTSLASFASTPRFSFGATISWSNCGEDVGIDAVPPVMSAAKSAPVVDGPCGGPAGAPGGAEANKLTSWDAGAGICAMQDYNHR